MTEKTTYKIKKQEVQPITTITLEDKPYEVDDMSDEIKRVVDVFNRWNEKEVDAQYEIELLSDNLTMIRSAKENLSRQIFDLMKKELDEKKKEEEPTEEPMEEPTEPVFEEIEDAGSNGSNGSGK
jgi:hypothetical protein